MSKNIHAGERKKCDAIGLFSDYRKNVITAAALKVFSRNFGQDLLSKNFSLLRLLFKYGSYYVITVFHSYVRTMKCLKSDLKFL